MATGFYATKLSENIGQTPDGFLVCRGSVLARTGWQTYIVSELLKNFPEEKLRGLGIETGNPGASISVYRPAEEVFAHQTILSAEGKPLTDGHPSEFVVPENFREHARGHIQNVRKGSTSLDSGDWPLEGDIVINDHELINKVDGGLRELSLGYNYDLARDGDKILQVGFVINHCAVVPKGRAGPEARINDSAAAETTDELRLVEAAAWTGDTQAKSIPDGNPSKEKNVAKTFSIKDSLRELFGAGLKAKATEGASASELATMAFSGARALDEEEEETEKEKEKGEDRKADDAVKTMLDAEKKRADDEKKRADDATKRADDMRKRIKDAGICMPGEEGHENCTADKCAKAKDEEEPAVEGLDRGAHDADGGDHRKRMHDAFDKLYDAHEQKHGPLEGEDADVEELKDLVSQFLSEEAEEPEHQEDDVDPEPGTELLEPVGEADVTPTEEIPMANDAAAALLPVIEKSREKKALMRAFDMAPIDSGEVKFLNAIKPAIARSRDLAVRRAYDAEVRRLLRTSRTAVGSYSDFGRAATARDTAAITSAGRGVNGPTRDFSKIQKIYNDARNGIKPKAE
jgi:hypothetical protein